MSRELDVFLHFLFLTTAIAGWLYCFDRKRDAYIYLIGWYLLATLIIDGAAATIMLNGYLAKSLVSNLFLYHLLVPVHYCLIMGIYQNVIYNGPVKRILLWSIPVFIIISIIFTLTVQGFTEYNSYAVLIKHAVTVGIILLFFRELILTTPYTRIYHQPIFWISLGFLFHSSLNIILEGVSNYLLTYSKHQYDAIYFLYSASNYCLFLLFALGFFLSKPNEDHHERVPNK